MTEVPGAPISDAPGNLLALGMQYLSYRHGRESLQKQEDTVKKDLMAGLAEHGQPDDHGHRFYYFPSGIGEVQGVKRERRVSQVMDEDVAMNLVEKYGLQDSCLETITVLNEEGLLAANFKGTISDEEMQEVYSQKETFALILVKERRD